MDSIPKPPPQINAACEKLRTMAVVKEMNHLPIVADRAKAFSNGACKATAIQ